MMAEVLILFCECRNASQRVAILPLSAKAAITTTEGPLDPQMADSGSYDMLQWTREHEMAERDILGEAAALQKIRDGRSRRIF